MGFKVGQQVVCTNGQFDMTDPEFLLVFKQLPVKDKVYTVRECDSPSVKLEEVINDEVPMDMGGITVMEEPAFNQNRFAPLLQLGDSLEDEIFETLGIERELVPLELDEI